MKKLSEKLEFLMLMSKTEAIISRKFSGQGLGFVDLAVLHAISGASDGKIRRIDLAEQVGLTASGVTRLLIPLEKIGVVKREVNERDARISYVAMTKSGQQLFEDSLKWIEEKVDDLIPDGNSKKIDQASELLLSIHNH
ncbi:MAG TPA: MarR family transcriptional regulator [Patescibacteria group bacterium]|nr:MarR family transcriptional regulator [Patescibacteria group bacterium]